MLPQPGKDPHQTASYRPILLLPVFSKILEKIIYGRIKPIIEKEKLIPDHQFLFRNRHFTIEQMHRLINAFDKINHESLLQLGNNSRSKYTN